MSEFDYGGSLDGIFYSYDYWRLARLLWEKWNQKMTPFCLTPFEQLSEETKKALLDIAANLSEFVKEDAP